MSAKDGKDCTLNRNTATYASPTWSELDLARDVTLNMSRAEGDASRRAVDFKLVLTGLKDIGIDAEVIWDPSDSNFDAILTAYLNDTNVELAIMDGPVATAGSEGVRGEFKVTQCNRSEPLDGGPAMANVTFKPAGDYTNAPEWYTVAS